MRGRALLLGSATGTLAGVSNDVQAMACWLDGLGFGLDVRQGPQATRAGMLDGLAQLARDVRPGEAIVVYYSGHGGFVSVPPRERGAGGRFAPRAYQYLVPTDHDKRRSFRGIFRAELSSMVRDISDRTSNITVILDCCHSTDMVRDDDLVLKSVVEPWSEGIEAHVAWLAQQGYDLERLPELRSASMVLVSACGAAQKAFEYTRRVDRLRHGLFTDFLLDVASRARDPGQVAWDALVRRVVDRVQRVTPFQRPQVSGPSSRRLFSEGREQSTGALTLHFDAGRWRLGGGHAAGVRQGDRYCIIDPLAEGSNRPLAEALVEEVEGHAAALSILEDAAQRIEPGMVAVPIAGGPPHQYCRVDGAGPLVEELRGRLAEIPGLEVMAASGHVPRVAFVLDVREREVDVLDDGGRKLRWPWRDAPDLEPWTRNERIDGFVDDLRALVRASDLLSLATRAVRSEASPAFSHDFAWGLVEGGAHRPLPEHGAELAVGDRIYVNVENTGCRPLHVSLLDVGVGRNVTLLNRNEPEGIDLGAGETELFGTPELRSLQGFEVAWPDDVPPDGPREESLILFVSSGPLPVDSWQTPSWRERPVLRAAERMLREPVYMVRRVSFLLHPRK